MMQQHKRWVGVMVSLVGVAMMVNARTTAAQSLPTTVGAGRLQGVVYDSVANGPLRRALVQAALRDRPAVSRSVRTDSTGRFTLDSLESGPWLLAVLDARLDSLGIAPLVREVDVRERRTTRVTLAVPSARTVYRAVCGEAPRSDSSGFLQGRLRDITAGQLESPGAIQLQWLDLVVQVAAGGRVQRVIQRADIPTSANGAFVACGVPAGGTLRVRGARGADSTGIIELLVPEHGIARVELALGRSRQEPGALVADSGDLAARATADSLGASLSTSAFALLRGSGVLQGRALGQGERPLANARVTVWGTGLESVTDADGRYALRGLPTGTHTVEIRAIGYAPIRQAVDILPDEATVVATTMDRLATLDTVRVRAMRLQMMGRDMREFLARRQQGRGFFRGPEELERMQPFSVADMLRTVPAVRVIPGRDGDRVLLRGSFNEFCVPDVYIDRSRMFGGITDGNIDAFLQANEVRAVEIYTSTMGTPPEFQTVGRCGAIVFWTGSRRPPGAP